MKKNNSQALKWICKQAKSVFAYVLVLTVMGIAISYLSVQFSLKSKDVLDVAQKSGLTGELTEKIIILLALVFFQVMLQATYSVLNTKTTAKFSIKLKKSVFNIILKRDYSSVTKYHTGELLNRINNDVSVIVSGVMNIIPNVVSLLSRIILSFLAIFMLDRAFATACLVLGPVILVMTRIYSKKMKALHKKCMETDGKTRSFMLECIQNLLVVKSYRNEEAVTEKSSEYQNENYKYTMKRSYISITMNVIFVLAISAAYYLALAYCAYKVAAGVMTFGTLMAIIQLVGQVQVPFKDLASSIPQYFSSLASAERLLELSEMPDCKTSLSIKKAEKPDLLAEFKNVTFAYDKETVLENADFEMKKGEFIAIGGLSGIGKSTFLKLILGIIKPDSGEVNVYAEKPDELLMAYVPQGNMILSGSIKENIAFYLPVNDEKIEEAAKIADIFEFINGLPDKFNTVLGEKGLGLSEGQIQRIAIARAVYSGAPFLILDECTSALDEKTEANVLNNLKKQKDKSCIIVSHKKAALDICEKLLKIIDKKPTLISKNPKISGE